MLCGGEGLISGFKLNWTSRKLSIRRSDLNPFYSMFKLCLLRRTAVSRPARIGCSNHLLKSFMFQKKVAIYCVERWKVVKQIKISISIQALKGLLFKYITYHNFATVLSRPHLKQLFALLIYTTVVQFKTTKHLRNEWTTLLFELPNF